MGRGGKEAGRGRLDPRSQHWPDGEEGGGGGGGGGGRGKKRGYKYNSMAVHTKFDLDLGDLRQSTKVKRSCWQRVSLQTAHHSSTLTSPAREDGGGGEGDRGTFQAKETLAAAASFKTDLL